MGRGAGRGGTRASVRSLSPTALCFLQCRVRVVLSACAHPVLTPPQAIDESVPGLSANPPWDFRLRPRGGLKEDGKTMMQWAGAPWKDPQQLDSSGRLKPQGPPEFFRRYLRLTKLDKPPAASLVSMAGLSSTNFVQCEANPGVALDKSNHKYRLLMIQDGQAKTVGRFHVEKEGIEGYNAYNDMQTKGPLGICGVPKSVGNIGPPGSSGQQVLAGPSAPSNLAHSSSICLPRLREYVCLSRLRENVA